MTAPPVLEAIDLTRRFGGVTAVDAMSLRLAKGEILGLIGPNGAGKTTMFDLLAGSVAPTSGRDPAERPGGGRTPGASAAGGRAGADLPDPAALSRTDADRKPVAGPPEPDRRAVLGQFYRPASDPRRGTRGPRQGAARFWIWSRCTRLADEPARVLSGGQRKLLELARVMMADPAVILLDEPAAGVNATLLEVIIDRIRAINAAGVTFLLIEHNIDMVTRLCHRVVVMASGAAAVPRAGPIRSPAIRG